MLNAMIISDMFIVIFIIKHLKFSGRNVMLRYVSDRIDGGAGCLCVGDRAGSARLVLFSRKLICCTDVDGDGSGGCFSAAQIKNQIKSSLFSHTYIMYILLQEM